MTHTPGPWSLAPHANDGGNIRAANGRSVASIHFQENDAEFSANARLVIAAPDLFALLKDAHVALPMTKHNTDLNMRISKLIAELEGWKR